MAKNIPLRETIKEYIFSTIGVILTALGLVIFLIPNNIAAGGASGLAIILHSIIPLSVGVWMYILNAILFLIAFLIIGFDFSYKTIYCTFLLNFFIDLFDRIINIPTYNGGDLFLAVFFGDILTAIGMAITFSQNASTGGTDILAKIFNKFFSTPMGTTLLIIDFTIGFFAGVAFNPKIGMYSILAIIINGITIDFVLKGLELAITVTIISDNNKPIEEFILTNMGRGFTYLKGKGGYTKKDRDIIFVSIRRRELGELINFVKKVDPNAFMIVNESRYVLGEGFKRNL
ncbi:transporter [Thermosipho africanus TCF52B]|uniref:Transporter n=1 Tax=Thermosipho africanus (strain TCF52B) TaxID=484019 RepID=B7IFC5_THEAB|nr:YitT family protein [Thermosipho africanus]ACJ74789.1 transporter [Thermosipho africanus TCF52B]